MQIEKEEIEHISIVLEEMKVALIEKNSTKLRDLSDNTIHMSCSHQDAESITIVILAYVLSKIVEREDYSRFKNWENFVEKFNYLLNLASKSIKLRNEKTFREGIEKAIETLKNISKDETSYIQDLIKKACINKASKIYEHGISLQQTAKLLGISQWELSDYVGQKSIEVVKETKKVDTKKRAKIALEFFGK
ncbi:MAG: hypothetical protein AABY05_00540 [Nanoarchaeota archaeon]